MYNNCARINTHKSFFPDNEMWTFLKNSSFWLHTLYFEFPELYCPMRFIMFLSNQNLNRNLKYWQFIYTWKSESLDGCYGTKGSMVLLYHSVYPFFWDLKDSFNLPSYSIDFSVLVLIHSINSIYCCKGHHSSVVIRIILYLSATS